MKKLITVSVLIFICLNAFAGGGKEILPPQIVIENTGYTGISPDKKDDIQDLITYKINYNAADKFVINSYSILIKNENGVDVFLQQDKREDHPDFFENWFTSWGLQKKKGCDAPEEFIWNGTDTDGNKLPDGLYTMIIIAEDDEGRIGRSEEITIYLDNINPQGSVSIPFEIFSPNGDGNQDVLIIEQFGAKEMIWKGQLLDSFGTVLISKQWEHSAPESFTWTGLQDSKESYPDGKYTYILTSTDYAGNTFSYSVDTIVIDNKERTVSLKMDNAFFSPNNDKVQDEIIFSPEISDPTSIREWSLKITDKNGSAVKSFRGYSSVPEFISFNGKNDSGKILKEGNYYAVFFILYKNGNKPLVQSPEFQLDITKPKAAVKRNHEVFSPNGDNNKDLVFLQQATSQELEWTGNIVNTAGEIVKSFSWKGKAEPYFYWDGTGENGNLTEDDSYEYVLASTDKAGNTVSVSSKTFQKDTKKSAISLAVENNFFNPLGEKERNFTTIVPQVEIIEGIEEFKIWIENTKKENIRSITNKFNINNFTWNGRSDSNVISADGIYFAIVEITYKNGNYRNEKSGPIYIDTIYPSVNVKTNNRYFSPDGDGLKDEITFTHLNISDEEKWTGVIKDNKENILSTIIFTGPPSEYKWNGADENGNIVDDGAYVYEISTIDAAGNRTTAKISQIMVDTKDVPLVLKVNSSSFSPNGDGRKDSILFTPQMEDSKNISNWTLEILNSKKSVQRTIKGTGNPPQKINFDGKSKSGKNLIEGIYYAELNVVYQSGKSPTGKSPEFTVDLTIPRAEITIADPVVSPNNDGRKDELLIKQSSSPEQEWSGFIIDKLGLIVKTFNWSELIPDSINWDGRNDSGKLVEDGYYSYKLEAIDKAGNHGISKSGQFLINTKSAEIVLTSKEKSFSPNGDGSQDSIKITPILDYKDGITKYTFSISDTNGKQIYSLSKVKRIPTEFNWNGKNSANRIVSDGVYKAKLEVEYIHGNISTAETSGIIVDTVFPKANISTSYLLFSPDGDDRKDVIKISQNSSEETLWEGKVFNRQRELVFKEFWQGNADEFSWNGVDDSGNAVPDGLYKYELSCTDDAGNIVKVNLDRIEVDTRKPYVYTTLSSPVFSPNNDKNMDTVQINLHASMSEEISKWKIIIYEVNYKKTVKIINSTEGEELPEKVSWDGVTSNGSVIDGEFKARLSVQYEKGDFIEAESSKSVHLDITGPKVDVKLSNQPFSPDDDGVNDTLGIKIKASDPSGVSKWKIEIRDPKGNPFRTLSGNSLPDKEITWNGLSDKGELVQSAEEYPMRVSVYDEQNNVKSLDGYVAVDVLVIKEGNRLKIRISSITFAPDSADFSNVDKEKADRNSSTLKRLAEIFKKYKDYRIVIEGHAASVYSTNKAKYEKEEKEELIPLSKERAEAVKKALVKLGLEAARIKTEGKGGRDPVVPHRDKENRWKNRRVEFILIKK